MSEQELLHMLRNNVGVSEAACRAANEAADCIEKSDAHIKELTLQLLAAHGQAADALDKLAKAVEALEYYNVAGHEGKEARVVLAELEGK